MGPRTTREVQVISFGQKVVLRGFARGVSLSEQKANFVALPWGKFAIWE
jgi:hypothetical protein